MSERILSAVIFLILICAFIFFLINRESYKVENEKKFIKENNCISHHFGNFVENEILYICESNIFYEMLDTKTKISKDTIKQIIIKKYTYVSKGLIGADSNINSNSIQIFNIKDEKILEIQKIDDELLLNNIKDSLKYYNYFF